MSTTLRDVFTQRANDIVPADLDLGELIDLGERRLRRRRILATVGSAAAVVLAIALALGGAALNRSADRDPTDHPTNTHSTDDDQTDRRNTAPDEAGARPLVYSDDVVYHDGQEGALTIHVGVVHVGEREVEIDQISHWVRGWSLHVTDAGIVYVKGDDNSVWFSDGGRPRQIAQRNCFNPDHYGGIATEATGTRAVWFDCTFAARGDLLVYDTGSGDEVARRPIPSCQPRWSSCAADAIVGDHVYFTRTWFRQEGPGPQHDGRVADSSRMFDLATGQLTPATPQMQAGDLTTQAGALVIGDSRSAGIVEVEPRFDVVGTHLVPQVQLPDSDETTPSRAFDTATGRPVQLHLPDGYHLPVGISFPDGPDAPEQKEARFFTTFQWLDEKTIALIQETTGDVITCHLPEGVCRLAARGDPDALVRMVPGDSFPG